MINDSADVPKVRRIDSLAIAGMGVAAACCYVAYFLTGSLAPGSILGKMALGLYLGLCGAFAMMASTKRRHSGFMWLWGVFLLMQVFGYLTVSNEQRAVAEPVFGGIIRTVVFTSLSIFPSYVLAARGIIGTRTMVTLGGTLVVTFLVVFLLGRSDTMAAGSDVTNAIYGLVYSLPFMVFPRKRIVSLLLAAVIVAATVLSFKRGALITVTVGLMVYSLFPAQESVERRGRWRRTWQRMAPPLVLFTMAVIVGANDRFSERFASLSDDGGSSRTIIMANLLDQWVSAPSLITQLAGFGFYGTVWIGPNVAHNDLLELLIDFGVIGVALYLLMWRKLFQKGVAMLRQRPDLARGLAIVLAMWIVDSQFQQWYLSLYPSASVIVLGYFLGCSLRHGGPEPALGGASNAPEPYIHATTGGRQHWPAVSTSMPRASVALGQGPAGAAERPVTGDD